MANTIPYIPRIKPNVDITPDNKKYDIKPVKIKTTAVKYLFVLIN